MPVQFIGKSGFTNTKPNRDEHFAVDGRTVRSGYGALSVQYAQAYEPTFTNAGSMVYMVADGRLLEIDFNKRTMRTVLEDKEIYAVGLAFQALDKVPDEEVNLLPRYIVARSREQLRLIHLKTGEQRVVQLPDELTGAVWTVFYVLSDSMLGQFSHYSNEPTTRNELYWFDDDGTITRHVTKDLKTGNVITNTKVQAGLVSLAGPAPLVSTFGLFVVQPLAYLFSGTEASYAHALGRSLGHWWPSLLATYLLGGVLAWTALKRHAALGLQWPRVWMIFVFVGGVPGVLGYLLHRSWPPREECPSCDIPAPRNRNECVACGEAFPAPESKGIELFA